jgi:hypothetical protein
MFSPHLLADCANPSQQLIPVSLSGLFPRLVLKPLNSLGVDRPVLVCRRFPELLHDSVRDIPYR